MATQQPTYKHIRKRLTQLVDKPNRIRTVVCDAGVITAEIEFSGSADDIWSAVIEEACKHAKLPSVISEVLRRYPIEAQLDSALSEAIAEEEAKFPSDNVLVALKDVLASNANATQTSEKFAVTIARSQRRRSGIILGLSAIICVSIFVTGFVATRKPTVRVFANKDELNNASRLGEVVSGARTFDFMGFSSRSLSENQISIRQALARGARIRIVLYDPGPGTAQFYDAVAHAAQENPSVKRDQARQVSEMVRESQPFAQQGGGSIELRYLSERPILYTMWISNYGFSDQCAHLSTFYYSGYQHTPSTRVCQADHQFITEASAEFNEVWRTAVLVPST